MHGVGIGGMDAGESACAIAEGSLLGDVQVFQAQDHGARDRRN